MLFFASSIPLPPGTIHHKAMPCFGAARSCPSRHQHQKEGVISYKMKQVLPPEGAVSPTKNCISQLCPESYLVDNRLPHVRYQEPKKFERPHLKRFDNYHTSLINSCSQSPHMSLFFLLSTWNLVNIITAFEAKTYRSNTHTTVTPKQGRWMKHSF